MLIGENGLLSERLIFISCTKDEKPGFLQIDKRKTNLLRRRNRAYFCLHRAN